jgi:hypothetical protein
MKYYKCFKESKKCSVHYYDSIKHDYKFLVNLALRTKLVIKDNPAKRRGTKRLRANTIRKAIKK